MIPEVILAALIIAWITGGNPGRLADAPVRHVWLLAVPVIAYAASWAIQSYTSVPASSWTFGALHLTSIGALILLCKINRRIPGATLIAIGLLMNALAIASNNGFMPASKTALVQVFGENFVNNATASEHVRSSIMDASTRLWLLCDIIPKSIGPYIWRGVYSIGDMLMTAGIAITILALSRVPSPAERRAEA